ncbi:hypothetical protein ACXDF8_00190 [Mycolicibacterium sp. CBM1]
MVTVTALAADATDEAAEVAEFVVSAAADDDPELFAEATEEVVVCADTDDVVRSCPTAEAARLEPDFAPPVPTT